MSPRSRRVVLELDDAEGQRIAQALLREMCRRLQDRVTLTHVDDLARAVDVRVDRVAYVLDVLSDGGFVSGDSGFFAVTTRGRRTLVREAS